MIRDDEIETVVRDLIESHMAHPERQAALEWLEKRAVAFAAMQGIGLVDEALWSASARVKRRPHGKA